MHVPLFVRFSKQKKQLKDDNDEFKLQTLRCVFFPSFIAWKGGFLLRRCGHGEV